MACGLEVRAPFLDAELVDSIQSLPAAFKYGRNQTKRLLKQAAAGRLPRAILARPKKGFGIPVARWLRGPLAPLLDDAPRPRAARAAGAVPPRRGRPPDRASTGPGVRDHRKPLWTLLMFQLWYDRWAK